MNGKLFEKKGKTDNAADCWLLLATSEGGCGDCGGRVGVAGRPVRTMQWLKPFHLCYLRA